MESNTDQPMTFLLADARVSVLSVGHLQVQLSDWLGPAPEGLAPADAAAFEGPVRMAVQTVLVQTSATTVLVDPARYEEVGASEWAIPDYHPPPDLEAQLAALGVRAEDVAQVVITHAHFDHYNACLAAEARSRRPRFPKATHYLGRADWEVPEFQAALRRPDSLEAVTLGALREAGMLRLTDGPTELGPGLAILPTPGESPGHQVLRLTRQGRTLYCLGDLYHHPVEIARPDLIPSWADGPALVNSRRRLAERALDDHALLVAAHIPGAGRLTRTETGLAWKSANPTGG